MENQYYRTFVGIPIEPGPGLLSLRSELMSSLREERISWVRPELYHVTLRFLGDRSISAVGQIRAALKNHMQLPEAAKIDLRGVGSFGPRKRPRVIWLGFQEVGLFNNLKRELDRVLQSCGIQAEDHPYNPHLTLGRVRSLKNPEAYYQCLNRLSGTDLEPVLVDRMVYYRSILGPQGPSYQTLEEYKLG